MSEVPLHLPVGYTRNVGNTSMLLEREEVPLGMQSD